MTITPSSQSPTETVADLERSLMRLGGDEALLRDMAGFFIEDAPPLVDQAREAAARGNREEVAFAAHSLKGLAATFDAGPLQETARRLEELAARDGSLDEAQTVASLEEQTGLLIQFLKQRLLA